MTSEELDLVDTEELLNAIKRRFDGGVIVLYRDKSDTIEVERTVWWGGVFRCLGLVQVAKMRLKEFVRRNHS